MRKTGSVERAGFREKGLAIKRWPGLSRMGLADDVAELDGAEDEPAAGRRLAVGSAGPPEGYPVRRMH